MSRPFRSPWSCSTPPQSSSAPLCVTEAFCLEAAARRETLRAIRPMRQPVQSAKTADKEMRLAITVDESVAAAIADAPGEIAAQILHHLTHFHLAFFAIRAFARGIEIFTAVIAIARHLAEAFAHGMRQSVIVVRPRLRAIMRLVFGQHGRGRQKNRRTHQKSDPGPHGSPSRPVERLFQYGTF